MTFLPIVQRELRVATRRRATHWNRSIVVLVATAIALWVLMGNSFQGPARLGATLFSVLSKLTFLGCLSLGVFLTADCLSSEKRDGTLGLLFLTDLRGYDVVLGKLFVTSLNAFYGFLAIFPVLALPLVLGGVTFGEFCRTVLALVNTVIFSLALGMFVSSASWKEQKAMLAAAGLLFLLGCILPALPGPCAWISPRLAFRLAADSAFALKPAAYGLSLLSIQGLSWGLLLLASRKAPGSILSQEWLHAGGHSSPALAPAVGREREHPIWHQSVAPAGVTPDNSREIIPGSALREDRYRPELLERDPIEWLASRTRSSGWVWASLLLVAIGWFAVCLETARGAGANDFVASFYMALSLHALLKFWIAWEAGRRFSEDQRNGTLELLLSTTLSVADLLRGQSKILYHEFLAPVRAVLILDFILMSWLGSSSFFGLSPAGAVASFALMMAMLVLDAWALGWVGLWLGLKGKGAWRAALGALARIIFLPMCLFMVLTPWLGAAGRGGPIKFIVLWALIGSINSWLFGVDARAKLHTRFRQTITDGPREAPSSPASATSPVPVEVPELGEYYSLFRTE